MKKFKHILDTAQDIKNGEMILEKMPCIDKALSNISDKDMNEEEKAKISLLKNSEMRKLLVGSLFRAFVQSLESKK